MQVLRAASEDEVIAEFLKAEVDSYRFSEPIFEALAAEGADRAVIDQSDLADRAANDIRRRVLERARHWRSGGDLFVGFPDDVRWHIAELDQSDMKRVLYINWEDWLEFSGGTRRAEDAVPRIRNRSTRFASEYDAIEARVRAGPLAFPRIIIVGEHDGSKLVLLEGHQRFTSLFMADGLPERLEVFFGTSPHLEEWALY